MHKYPSLFFVINIVLISFLTVCVYFAYLDTGATGTRQSESAIHSHDMYAKESWSVLSQIKQAVALAPSPSPNNSALDMQPAQQGDIELVMNEGDPECKSDEDNFQTLVKRLNYSPSQ